MFAFEKRWCSRKGEGEPSVCIALCDWFTSCQCVSSSSELTVQWLMLRTSRMRLPPPPRSLTEPTTSPQPLAHTSSPATRLLNAALMNCLPSCWCGKTTSWNDLGSQASIQPITYAEYINAVFQQLMVVGPTWYEVCYGYYLKEIVRVITWRPFPL